MSSLETTCHVFPRKLFVVRAIGANPFEIAYERCAMTQWFRALLLSFALVVPISAQNVRTLAHPPPLDDTRRQRVTEIHGQVRLPDGSPASGARVNVAGTSRGDAKTDSSGKFQIDHLVPGKYYVHVWAPGYQGVSQQVDLESARGIFLDFTLRPATAARGPAVQSQPAAPLPAIHISAGDTTAPESARKNYEEAERMLVAGNNVNTALELLKTAISQYPEYIQAHLLMGAAYSSQENWEEAQKAFQKAVELDQKNADAYIGLGAVENEKKNFPEAENHLLKAVELAPVSADAHFELGRAYYGQERWQLADQQLAKANELRPDNAQQHAVMGNILLREHNAEGALKQFQEALRLDPNGPLAVPTHQMIERLETALKQSGNQKQ